MVVVTSPAISKHNGDVRSPILFIIFNRPDTTFQVMETIRKARPRRLYIAGDGPRNNHDELELCKESRKISSRVDWQCEVKTLWHDRNLGCRAAITSAIDWFFSYEEEGIILEDDCVPSNSFYDYCDNLLERYRNDHRIMAISGANLLTDYCIAPDSYYFSRYPHIWGWATWRRAWRCYDRDMALWPEFSALKGLHAWSYRETEFEAYWTNIFNHINEIDTWDYQWLFTCWAYNGLSCIPAKNLVKNIGFDNRATHTLDSSNQHSQLTATELSFPLAHPKLIIRHAVADYIISQCHHKVSDYYASKCNLNKSSDNKILSSIARQIYCFVNGLKLKRL